MKNQDLFANLKMQIKKGKLAIDVRTKTGQIIAPFSPYDTRDKEKIKFKSKNKSFFHNKDYGKHHNQ